MFFLFMSLTLNTLAPFSMLYFNHYQHRNQIDNFKMFEHNLVRHNLEILWVGSWALHYSEYHNKLSHTIFFNFPGCINVTL